MNDIIYSNFIKTLKTKIPQRGKLTTFLIDLLYIEKEAIYRRLRGEVPFTFGEITKIAKELNISLDAIIGTNSSKSRPFQMKFVEFNNPTEADYAMFEEFVELIRYVKNDPISEFGCASSSLPPAFMMEYKNIFRFYLLKWAYQISNLESISAYKDIQPTQRHEEYIKQYLQEASQIHYTCYIWDKMTLLYLVNDINYFYSIRLLKNEDIIMLKEEIFILLDELEKTASEGSFKTGKQVQIFISNLNFETNYSYMQTSSLKLTMIRSFALNETASLDEEVFIKLKAWILSLKRTSTLISESGEMQRIKFFDGQRKLIEDNFVK